MTVSEAKQIQRSFYRIDNPTQDDVFIFTEAMDFLINQTHDPLYMMELGGYYYETQNFSLAQKYYELAAEYKVTDAYLCLGYVWYYGRTGTRDFEKAFNYYSLAKEAGSTIAAYKLADMYKNGYFVEKDYGKYKEIIEDLYSTAADAHFLGDPLPEVFTRLATIRAEEGNTGEAISLYLRAKDFLAQRISYNAFFGDLNIMMWLIDDLYSLRDFDTGCFDFYDLYYLLAKPCTIGFYYSRKPYKISAREEDGEFSIEFNGKYYRSREDFFKKAAIGGRRLTSIYSDLYGFEVL